jgi:hypothetical protein
MDSLLLKVWRFRSNASRSPLSRHSFDEDGRPGQRVAVPCSASAAPRNAIKTQNLRRQPPSALRVIAKIDHSIGKTALVQEIQLYPVPCPFINRNTSGFRVVRSGCTEQAHNLINGVIGAVVRRFQLTLFRGKWGRGKWGKRGQPELRYFFAGALDAQIQVSWSFLTVQHRRHERRRLDENRAVQADPFSPG